jgi:hypothetical protein
MHACTRHDWPKPPWAEKLWAMKIRNALACCQVMLGTCCGCSMVREGISGAFYAGCVAKVRDLVIRGYRR